MVTALGFYPGLLFVLFFGSGINDFWPVTTINLYQPGKLNAYLQFPTEWDELLPAEVIEICRQQLLLSNNKEAAKASILHFIIHIRAKLYKIKLPSGWVKMMDVEQAALAGSPLLDFLYEENSLTQAPENRIKLPGFVPVTVYGPEKGFESITCGEFEDAEIFFYEFFDNPNGESLAKLASVFWRPKHPLTQERKRYRTFDYRKLVKRFLKLSPWRLYAIFTWYTGSRRQLPIAFPTVHETHGESKNDEPDILAFTKCIHAGAGPKNGSRNDIRMGKLFEFFFEMEQEAIKAKEIREEYERMKNQ